MLLTLLNCFPESSWKKKISTRTEEFILLYGLMDEVFQADAVFLLQFGGMTSQISIMSFLITRQVLQDMFTNFLRNTVTSGVFIGVSYSPLKPKCRSLARQDFHSGLNYIEVLWLLILK